MKCKECGSEELVYNQRLTEDYCQMCNTWQGNRKFDTAPDPNVKFRLTRPLRLFITPSTNLGSVIERLTDYLKEIEYDIESGRLERVIESDIGITLNKIKKHRETVETTKHKLYSKDNYTVMHTLYNITTIIKNLEVSKND